MRSVPAPRDLIVLYLSPPTQNDSARVWTNVHGVLPFTYTWSVIHAIGWHERESHLRIIAIRFTVIWSLDPLTPVRIRARLPPLTVYSPILPLHIIH